MKKLVILEIVDAQAELFELQYDDGSSELMHFPLDPNGVHYESFGIAKRSIMRRLQSRFGTAVKFGEYLQTTIDNRAVFSSLPHDEEEEEANRATQALRKLEEADERRERWLYKR